MVVSGNGRTPDPTVVWSRRRATREPNMEGPVRRRTGGLSGRGGAAPCMMSFTSHIPTNVRSAKAVATFLETANTHSPGPTHPWRIRLIPLPREPARRVEYDNPFQLNLGARRGIQPWKTKCDQAQQTLV